MPDIAMCTKEDCPSFSHCYRAQARPNKHRQSYMNFDNKKYDECADYIPVSAISKIYLNDSTQGERL